MTNQLVQVEGFTPPQIELLKNTVCKGASNDELKLFLYVCKHTKLDPFLKQIYSISRGGQRTIQTSIDGLRLIADRTGKYCPGREPSFVYDQNKCLFAATSYVKKKVGGEWHEISATAIFSEYDAGNNPWKKMPHVMIAKCAEAAALRRAFPAEMAGIYAEEEMDQADKNTINIQAEKNDVKPLYKETKSLPNDLSNRDSILKNEENSKFITSDQAKELEKYLDECDPNFKNGVLNYVKVVSDNKYEGLEYFPAKNFERTLEKAKENREEYIAKQREEVTSE